MLGGFGYIDPNTGGFVEMNNVRNDLLPDSMWVQNYDNSEQAEQAEQQSSVEQNTVPKNTLRAKKRDFLRLPAKQGKANTPTIFNDHAFELAGTKYQIGDTFEYKGKQYKVIGNNEAVPVN
jgi:hypothetical protein